MIIGAQLYTVRDYCKTLPDFKETLRKLKEFGYTTVQISGVPLEPKEVREACDEAGLKIIVTHTNPDKLLADPLAVVEDHKILGCDNVGIGAMPGKYRETGAGLEGIKSFIRDFNKAAKVLKANGMTFHYHNHSFEFQKYNDKTGFDTILEETEKGLWYFIFDTYWAQHGGANPVEYIEKMEGRIKALHFKDMAIVDGNQRFAAIGQGNLNWDKIINVCNKTNIPYAMIEQDAHFVDDAITELGRSYKFLSGKGLK